ncbi:MAG: MBL fold metallo-hydrolase [Acidobacteriota bacterium]
MHPIKVVFLGTGDAYSAEGRHQTAILIRHPEVSFLLDCGATTLASLNRQGLSFDPLDFILISHLHGDHIGGLPFLLLHFCYIEPRSRTLEIMGPQGLDARTYDLFRAMYPDAASQPLPFDLSFTPLEVKRRHRIGGLDIEPFPVPHLENPPSFGYSLKLDGRKIVYSGDSGWTEELTSHAEDADLFICECSFFESEAPQHLNYPTIKKRLANCGARRTVLTHIGQEVLEHRAQVDLEMAEDGHVVEI